MDGIKAGANLVELHCGCSCEECISNYKSYWTEKVYSKEIRAALDEELAVRKEVLVEMSRVEMSNKTLVEELQLSLVLANSKCKSLSEALESERQLRAEEVYRREVQKEELIAAVAEGARLEAKSIQQERDLAIARQEIIVLKEAARSAILLKDKAVAKLREYESLVNGLEREGAENRNRVYTAEIEGAKLKYKNDCLREKLESIRPYQLLKGGKGGSGGDGGDGGRAEGGGRGAEFPEVHPKTGGGLSRQIVSKQRPRVGKTMQSSLLQSSLDEEPSMLSSITGW